MIRLSLLLGLRIRINQIAGLVGGRPQDRLFARILELHDIVAAGDMLELRVDDARLRPFAIGAEAYFADDGRDWMAVDIVGDLRRIEALRSLDPGSEDLRGRIRRGRISIAERIDAQRWRRGLIFRHER